MQEETRDAGPGSAGSVAEETASVADEAEVIDNVVDIATKSILKELPAPAGRTVTMERWCGLRIPYGYKLNEKGLAKMGGEDGTKPILFAGPIIVLANTAGIDGANAGIVIEFQNKRGQYISMSVPLTRLHEDAKLLAQDLASHNFFIMPGKEKDILCYLAQCKTDSEKIAVSQTGWAATDDPDQLVFVSQGQATHPDYFFQPERHSPSSIAKQSSGTLDDWIRYTFDSSAYSLFSILCSLSAPLIKWTGMPTIGVHLWGSSTCGKTTLAQVAASVWGNGSDPADAQANPYVKRWNVTRNALEALAAAHNHLPFIMDEMGSLVGQSEPMVYDLSGGQGKSSLDASRNLRRQRTWQTFVISTGEMSSVAKMEENPYGSGKRKHAKAGAALRLLDIQIQQGAISSGARSDELKRAASKYYGVLGPKYIDRIIENFNGTKLRNTIISEHDKAVQRLEELSLRYTAKLSGIQRRALKTFALAEVAGLLLVYLDLIPGLTIQQVRSSVDRIVIDWLPDSRDLDDGERALFALREYILKYRDSRFKKLNATGTSESEKTQLAGYFEEHYRGDYFHLQAEAFYEATAGEYLSAGRLLKERGWLKVNKDPSKKTLTNRIRLEGRRINVYSVSVKILGDAATKEEREKERQAEEQNLIPTNDEETDDD